MNERVARLKPVDAGKLRSFLNKPRDDVHGLFTDFLRDVLFRNRDVFVEIGPWTRMMEEKAISQSDDKNTALAVSMLSPKLLNGAILLGANIKSSMLYDWYRRYYGVRFQEFEPIKRHLRKV